MATFVVVADSMLKRVLDCSTSDPSSTRRLAALAAELELPGLLGVKQHDRLGRHGEMVGVPGVFGQHRTQFADFLLEKEGEINGLLRPLA